MLPNAGADHTGKRRRPHFLHGAFVQHESTHELFQLMRAVRFSMGPVGVLQQVERLISRATQTNLHRGLPYIIMITYLFHLE